jgi:hypothetical protein
MSYSDRRDLEGVTITGAREAATYAKSQIAAARQAAGGSGGSCGTPGAAASLILSGGGEQHRVNIHPAAADSEYRCCCSRY